MLKRFLDIVLSFFGLIILSPLLLIIGILVFFTSRGGIFFLQERIGRNLKPFKIIKFRSMYSGSHKRGDLTSYNDKRITSIGKFIRKFKLDEIPQLINILKGDMSFVGPRPETYKYLDVFTEENKKVFSVRPGLTDYASIVFSQEEKFFINKDDVEKYYINTILPKKIKLSLKYIEEQSFSVDLAILLKTLKKVLKHD